MRATALAALFLTAVTISTSAGAQVSDSRMEDYRAEAGAGVEAFNAGDMARARASFERAARILPNPRVYRLLGRVALAEQQWVEAAKLFHQALTVEEAGHPLSERLRTEVESELLARARAHVAEYTLDVDPAGAIIRVDETPIELIGQTLILSPGNHIVVVDAPGRETEQRQLTSAAGTREVLRLHLSEPGAVPDPQETAAAANDQGDGATVDDEGGGMSTGAIVGAISLGVAGFAALGASIAGMTGGGCLDTNAAGDCIERDETATGPVALYGTLGVLAIASAIVWLVVGSGDDDDDEEQAVSLEGSTVRWTF